MKIYLFHAYNTLFENYLCRSWSDGRPSADVTLYHWFNYNMSRKKRILRLYLAKLVRLPNKLYAVTAQ